MKIYNFTVLSTGFVIQKVNRDGKTYERASNACVKMFIVWVKSVTNSTLFGRESELCCDFALFGVILMAFNKVNF